MPFNSINIILAYFLHEKEDQVRESNYELANKSKIRIRENHKKWRWLKHFEENEQKCWNVNFMID